MSRAPSRKPAACSSAGGASVSTRCSTTRRLTDYAPARRPDRLVGPASSHGRAIGVLAAHDSSVSGCPLFRRRPSPRRGVRLTCCGRRRSLRAVARDALRRVVAAQELERRRLARELHDETGQALTSILLGLKPLEERASAAALSELRELVVATLQDVRRLAVELRPPALDDFGLVPALERLTETFAEQTGITVDFEAAVPSGCPTSRDRPLPDRAGVAHECGQARPCARVSISRHAQ